MERIEITCADGVILHGHFLTAHTGQHTSDHPPVLISPATGVKQTYYLRFAQWLSQQGHDVMVFDYRGIGLSLHGKLSDCTVTLADWGQKDQVAAIEFLLNRTGAQQIVLVGHSAGGQMIGLLPNHHRIQRLVGVAASTGWFKGMRRSFAIKANLGLNVLMPIASQFMGYAPTSKLGLGEDLPARVAREWGRWCANGGYATHAVRTTPNLDFHQKVTTPISVFYASDDDIATDITVRDLLQTLPNAPARTFKLEPAQFGLKSLGHLEWFRQSHQAVWPLIADTVKGK